MRPLSIDSYRRAEAVPGYSPRPAWIHVNDGTRQTGASVLVDHSDPEFATTVADAIAFYCVACEVEKAPTCKHGHPWFCVLCGPVSKADQ